MRICPACRTTYPDSHNVCVHDRTPLEFLDMEVRVGDTIRGKYKVLEQVGRGGMATVYKVEHLAFHDIAAVKVVHAELLGDEDFLKRFRNEAVVARQLRHPNAVLIEDFDFTDDGQPFIVMEYVRGRSLFEARREMPQAWPIDVSLRLVARVAAALEAAHALGIVHRDIKPSNILLARGAEGQEIVKVLDFGIAKVEERAFAGMTSVKTVANMLIGTPEYMSPEQALASEDSRIDGRSDVYSLGMVLYELVTGSHPFQADTPIAMLMHQVQTSPHAPHIVEGSIPPPVSALILKALRKEPSERFQSAGEMLAALQDPDGWYARLPASERRPSAPQKPQNASELPTAMFAAPSAQALASAAAAAGQGKGQGAPASGSHRKLVVDPVSGARRPGQTPGRQNSSSGPASGPHRAPDGLHQAPSGLHQAPSGLHQAPSGLHQAPSGLHQAPSGPHQRRAAGMQTPGSRNDPATASRKPLGFLGLLFILALIAAALYFYFKSQGGADPFSSSRSSGSSVLAASAKGAIVATPEFCDFGGMNCESHFSTSAVKRVRMKLSLHRLLGAGAESVPVQVVVSRDGTVFSKRSLGACSFAAGKTETRCDARKALGTPETAFHAGVYRVQVLGQDAAVLGSADLSVTP